MSLSLILNYRIKAIYYHAVCSICNIKSPKNIWGVTKLKTGYKKEIELTNSASFFIAFAHIFLLSFKMVYGIINTVKEVVFMTV